jgi:HEAT repeats
MAALALAFLYLLRAREPSYHGKPLTAWLEQYGTNISSHSGTNTSFRPGPGPVGRAVEAQAALRQIGAKALPTCLALITARESPLKVKLLTLVPASWLRRLHLPTPAEYRKRLESHRLLGADGLGAVGEQARPALPALLSVLGHNKDRAARQAAITALNFLGPIASDAVPELITCLKDPDQFTRMRAVEALGGIHSDPEQVVPALIGILEDFHTNSVKDNVVAWLAALSLGQFGAQATPAIPILCDLLHDPDFLVREGATDALSRIDLGTQATKPYTPPGAEPAIPILCDLLHNPAPPVRSAAASALGKFGTQAEPAVRILRELLHDPDLGVRNTAAAALARINPTAAAAAQR